MSIRFSFKPSYRVDEVAVILSVHPKTVTRLIHRGQLTAFKIGRMLRVKGEAVEEFEKKNGLEGTGKDSLDSR